jgi:hypothetical protein
LKWAAIDFGVVHVEADGQTTGGDGLAQTVQAGIQPLAGIELGVRDEPAGIVESGVASRPYLAAAGALDVGAEEYVGLRPERETPASPTGGIADRQTGSGGR